ncbi:MAG: TRAP transporter substrate-binding protein [Candidatus Adiutrix sp.]|jgi:tripartite ATP-independent transporter DctP family solute receptor|nr:TRAP transporter substrate-binding protein [Candidatus Adiutrix sp.]
MLRSLLCAISAVTLSLVLFASASAQAVEYKKQTVMVATANPPGGYHALVMDKFKEVLEKESGGAITVRAFYSGSMGDEQTNVKQLRTQELHATVVFTGNLSPFAPTANLFCLPYLYPEMQDAYNLFSDQAFMKKTADIIAKESGGRSLGWLVGGYRFLTNSKHPVKKITDLAGIKIRVSPSAGQLESFRAWDVDPHPMAWTEVFNALQQKVIDAVEAPYSMIRDQKFWEVTKYISEVHYMMWVGNLLVSEPWYQKLDPDTKALVDKAALEAERYSWQLNEDLTQPAIEECTSHGMEISILEDEPVWVEKAKARVWPMFYKDFGFEGLAKEAVAIIEKTRK